MSISRRLGLCSALGLMALASPSASAQGSATRALFDDMIGAPALHAVLTRWPLFPDNVDCRDFDKTGYRIWTLREKLKVDLGDWDRTFAITGPISPRAFVRKGIDLYDVLERKCAIHAS